MTLATNLGPHHTAWGRQRSSLSGAREGRIHEVLLQLQWLLCMQMPGSACETSSRLPLLIVAGIYDNKSGAADTSV